MSEANLNDIYGVLLSIDGSLEDLIELNKESFDLLKESAQINHKIHIVQKKCQEERCITELKLLKSLDD